MNQFDSIYPEVARRLRDDRNKALGPTVGYEMNTEKVFWDYEAMNSNEIYRCDACFFGAKTMAGLMAHRRYCKTSKESNDRLWDKKIIKYYEGI